MNDGSYSCFRLLGLLVSPYILLCIKTLKPDLTSRTVLRRFLPPPRRILFRFSLFAAHFVAFHAFHSDWVRNTLLYAYKPTHSYTHTHTDTYWISDYMCVRECVCMLAWQPPLYHSSFIRFQYIFVSRCNKSLLSSLLLLLCCACGCVCCTYVRITPASLLLHRGWREWKAAA